MQERFYYTYIVGSRTHALYIGVTGNLERRVMEHKEGMGRSFAATYNCNRLIWFERYVSPHLAIAREKQLKGWTRQKKISLIEKENPTWIDLSSEWGTRLSIGGKNAVTSTKEKTAYPIAKEKTAGPSTSPSQGDDFAQDDG